MLLARGENRHSPSDRCVVFRVILTFWAYCAVCGVAAVGLGFLVADLADSFLPASVIRVGTISIMVCAAGIFGDRVLRRIEKVLGANGPA